MGQRQEQKAQWQLDAQKLAFEMSKRTGKALGVCYNQVAREQGFKSWNHMCAAMKSIT